MSRTPMLGGHPRLPATILITGVLALAGCSDDGSAGPAAGGGEITVGAAQFMVEGLTPGNSSGSYVNNAIFTPLTQLDPVTGEVANAVAETIESDDNQTWTITIEDGWTFHDGEPVTAQSFADSWNATANPDNAMTGSYLLAPIEGYAEMMDAEGGDGPATLAGVEVTGERELTVTLTEPNALFTHLLSSTVLAPIPTGATDDIAAFDANPVGNGPFQVTNGGVVPGSQEVVLERYEEYAGEPAKIDTVRLRVYQDLSAVYTDFQAGGVDLALIDGPNLAQAQALTPDQVVEAPFPAVIWLGLPTWHDGLEDHDVRVALSQAIDRETIIESLLDGNGDPAVGSAPALLPGGGEVACSHCTYNLDAAQELYGETDGFDDTLHIYSDTDPTNQSVAQAVANQLRTNLGVQAVAETMEVSALYDGLEAESIEGAFVLYSGTNTPNVYGLVQTLFDPTSFLNGTHYDNPEVTALLGEAVAANDVDGLIEKSQQADALAMADARVIPLYHPAGGLVHGPNVTGVTPEFFGGPALSLVEITE